MSNPIKVYLRSLSFNNITENINKQQFDTNNNCFADNNNEANNGKENIIK